MAFCLRVSDPVYRFTVLFFNCMLTFGSYFCFDMPSVLQGQLQGNYNCNTNSSEERAHNTSGNSTCCSDCLGMTPSEYNLLYSIYAWMNAIVVIVAGFLIDKLGNRVGVFLFSSLCVIGSAVFALGTMFRGSAALLPLMLIGRLLCGAGNGSLIIAQNRITAYWFTGKELAFAFGVTLAFSRVGSVLNFFLTSHMYNSMGLCWTLWIGAILCGAGFLSAIVISFLDTAGVHELGQSDALAIQSKKVHITDVKFFSVPFWLLVVTIMFFYNGIFPFVADASKFIQDKYGYDSNTSAYMAGAVYDVSMILCPFLGGLIDVFGKRGILAFSCAVLTIPVFGLLAFSTLPPLVSTLWLGVTYSIAAASMWPSIPLVVSQATVGTAMGLAISVQMVGFGISNVIVGQILGKTQSLSKADTLKRWKYVMIYLLMNNLASVATSVALNLDDRKKSGVLNLNHHEIKQILHENLTNETDTNAVSPSEEEATERDPLLKSSAPLIG